jgi:S1-C subfamily serine protease
VAAKAVAAKVSPALVDINTNLGYQSSQAAGTGMVMTSNGLVLTNNHVIDGATQISATDIGNGKTYTAKVVGYNRTSDIAVIQLQNASGLTVASFGNSNNVSVGQSVVGVGNAGGAGGTPSSAAGTVTALNQSITASDESSSNTEQLTGLIQTNAPIQPGDSGGPLVTMGAQVIGMDTAASTNFSFSQGDSQGFAIPINNALSIAHKIIAGQASSTIHLGETGFLGVEVQANSGSSSNSFGNGSNNGGSSAANAITVVGTVSGSPAANAGLVQGDTITAVNGVSVTTPSELTAVLSRYHPGDTITMNWTDTSGNPQSAQITLEKGPAA